MRRSIRAISAGCALALGVMLAGAPSFALSLAAGQVLEVPFTLSGPGAGVDTLTFRLVNVSAVGVSTMTVELWNGAALLGSVSGVPVSGIAAFVDAGSLWTTNAVSTNLASVRDGTIDGLVRVAPDFSSGSLDADVSAITSFVVGHGTDAASITPLTGVLTVGAPRVAPEPGSAALLGAAALLLRMHLRR